MPEPLRQVLGTRPITWIEVTDRYAAFAAFLEAENDRPPGAPLPFLLLVEPGQLGDPEGVVRALRAYVPGVIARVYEPGANPPLRAGVGVSGMDVPTPEPEPAASAVEADDRHAASEPPPGVDPGVLRVLRGDEENGTASEERAGGAASGQPGQRAGAQPGPALKLSGEGTLGPESLDPGGGSADSDRGHGADGAALLSDEELDMLLGDEPGDGPRPSERGGPP